MKFTPIILILLLFAVPALAGTPNISIVPATDPIVTSIGAPQSWKVSSNQTVNVTWLINGTQVQYDSNVVTSFYYNQSAMQGYWNLTIRVNNSNGANSTMINWTVANVAAISATSPTVDSTTTTINSTFSQFFNTTINQTSNVLWKMNGIRVQYNDSVTVANYTNSTAPVGTYTVTATTNNSNGTGNIITWTWIIKKSTMSATNLTTNLSNAGRTVKGTNSSLNFSWKDTGNITTVNLTFPAGFNFSALEYKNISSNLGNVTVNVLDESAGLISLYNGTGLNNSNIYVNFTTNLTVPAAAGNYIVTVTTNKNLTGTSFTVFARNSSRPFYSSANNSIFAISSETWTDTGTTLIISGKGNANLTINVPAFSSSINVSRYGYTATNAKMVRIDNSSGQMFIIPDPDVQDPVIVITQSTSLAESNLPAVLTGAGAIVAVYVIYKFKKRTR